MTKGKPRYRYNWVKKKWDKLIQLDTGVVIFNGTINPKTGLYNTMKVPFNSPLARIYREQSLPRGGL